MLKAIFGKNNTPSRPTPTFSNSEVQKFLFLPGTTHDVTRTEPKVKGQLGGEVITATNNKPSK